MRIFFDFIQICTFSILGIFGQLFAEAPPAIKTEPVKTTEEPKPKEEPKKVETTPDVKPPETTSVPTWLIQKPFRVLQKLSVLLDGGKDAAGLRRQSENESRLIFLDAGHWRFRQELPFTGQAREILKNDSGFHRMTQQNKAVDPTEKIADDTWTQLVQLPHDLSKRWGFMPIDSTWGDWISKVKELKEPYKNSDGDTVRVTVTKTGEIEKTFVVLEGSLPHEDSTRMKIKVEWTLEQNIELKAEDLNKSLLGGA